MCQGVAAVRVSAIVGRLQAPGTPQAGRGRGASAWTHPSLSDWCPDAAMHKSHYALAYGAHPPTMCTRMHPVPTIPDPMDAQGRLPAGAGNAGRGLCVPFPGCAAVRAQAAAAPGPEQQPHLRQVRAQPW